MLLDSRSADALGDHIKGEQKDSQRVLVAAFTAGALDRLAKVMGEHGFVGAQVVETWEQALALDPALTALTVFGLERGFRAPGLSVMPVVR